MRKVDSLLPPMPRLAVRKLSFGTALVVRLMTPPPNSPGKLAE